MKRYPLALLIITLLIAAPVLAADPEPVTPTSSGLAGEGEPAGGSVPHLDINQAEMEQNEGQVPLHPELTRDLAVKNPVMARINEVLAQSEARLVELQTRLEAETSDLAKLEIIKQIEQTRVQTELDVLGTQASYARQTGREDVALEIEGAIAEMTAPRPVRQPVDRPAPGAGSH
jgi:hypothetical protein|nr:hypothetical protein [Candidatus Krumholzibacteria bacterium]